MSKLNVLQKFLLTTLIFFTSVSASQANVEVSAESLGLQDTTPVEVVSKEDVKLACRLLLKFAQFGIDLCGEYEYIKFNLLNVHDTSLTSDKGVSLNKLLTKEVWNQVKNIESIKKEFETLVVDFIEQSDFLIDDSVDVVEFKTQIDGFSKQALEFCKTVGINIKGKKESDSIKDSLYFAENIINQIESELTRLEDEPMFTSKFKKLFWGSDFSYTYLPACLTVGVSFSELVPFLTNSSTNPNQTLKKNLILKTVKLLLGGFVNIYKEEQADYYKLRKARKDYRVKQKYLDRNVFSYGNSEDFSNIVGYEGVKKQLSPVISSLLNPLKFKKLGISVPGGILLTGSPGVGKTMFARAIATEAKCQCWVVNPGDLKNIDYLFHQAERSAPSILFFDEIDFVGTRKEKKDHLGFLLTKLNGFKVKNPYRPVLIVAATNRYGELDDALVRSGRFDVRLHLNLPNKKERSALIERELSTKNASCAQELNLKKLVKITDGCSSAGIINTVNRAFLKTSMTSACPTLKDFKEAVKEIQKLK